MNKYHDKRRKLEYKKITKMLEEEARKGGKRVAMNDDDNEIRLTDDEGSHLVSNINLDNSDSTFRAQHTDKFIGTVLPVQLTQSLNKSKYFLTPYNNLDISDANVSKTIKDLNSGLGKILK
jgi:hypothetical protein